MNKICPKCGGDRFYASQVQRCNVIVDGKNNWNENVGCYDADDPYGPYACVKCGKRFESLDELREEAVYTKLTLCSTDDLYYIGLPAGTTQEKLKGKIASAVSSFGEKTRLNGYYCFRAYNDGSSTNDVKGAVLIDNEEDCDPVIEILENPGEQKKKRVRLSIRYLCWTCADHRITQIEPDLFLIKTSSTYPHLCHAVEEADVFEADDCKIIEVSDVNPMIRFRLRIKEDEFEQARVIYACYEGEKVQYFSQMDAESQYLDNIDKREYPNYECWIDDMLRSGVLERV